MAYPTLNNIIRLIALFILLGVAVYIYFLSSTEDSMELKEKISQLSTNNLALPITLSLISYLLRFTRWRIILKQLGHNVSIKNDLMYYLSGFALTMTPGKSGETIRSAFLLRDQVPFRASLSAFIIERSFDLIIVGLLATLLFIPYIATLLLFLLALLAIVFIAGYLARRKHHIPKKYLPNFLLRLLIIISESSAALKPKAVFVYALLGCAAWAAQGLGFYYIVSIFYQDIGTLNAISTYCAGLFIGAVSLIPGGIGVTEGSLSWLLQNQGVDQNSAILSALISRGCTLWLAVAIGCGALAAIIKGHSIPKK